MRWSRADQCRSRQLGGNVVGRDAMGAVEGRDGKLVVGGWKLITARRGPRSRLGSNKARKVPDQPIPLPLAVYGLAQVGISITSRHGGFNIT